MCPVSKIFPIAISGFLPILSDIIPDGMERIVATRLKTAHHIGTIVDDNPRFWARKIKKASLELPSENKITTKRNFLKSLFSPLNEGGAIHASTLSVFSFNKTVTTNIERIIGIIVAVNTSR